MGVAYQGANPGFPGFPRIFPADGPFSLRQRMDPEVQVRAEGVAANGGVLTPSKLRWENGRP